MPISGCHDLPLATFNLPSRAIPQNGRIRRKKTVRVPANPLVQKKPRPPAMREDEGQMDAMRYASDNTPSAAVPGGRAQSALRPLSQELAVQLLVLVARMEYRRNCHHRLPIRPGEWQPRRPVGMHFSPRRK